MVFPEDIRTMTARSEPGSVTRLRTIGLSAVGAQLLWGTVKVRVRASCAGLENSTRPPLQPFAPTHVIET
jgi:hypothetical protein